MESLINMELLFNSTLGEADERPGNQSVWNRSADLSLLWRIGGELPAIAFALIAVAIAFRKLSDNNFNKFFSYSFLRNLGVGTVIYVAAILVLDSLTICRIVQGLEINGTMTSFTVGWAAGETFKLAGKLCVSFTLLCIALDRYPRKIQEGSRANLLFDDLNSQKGRRRRKWLSRALMVWTGSFVCAAPLWISLSCMLDPFFLFPPYSETRLIVTLSVISAEAFIAGICLVVYLIVMQGTKSRADFIAGDMSSMTIPAKIKLEFTFDLSKILGPALWLNFTSFSLQIGSVCVFWFCVGTRDPLLIELPSKFIGLMTYGIICLLCFKRSKNFRKTSAILANVPQTLGGGVGINDGVRVEEENEETTMDPKEDTIAALDFVREDDRVTAVRNTKRKNERRQTSTTQLGIEGALERRRRSRSNSRVITSALGSRSRRASVGVTVLDEDLCFDACRKISSAKRAWEEPKGGRGKSKTEMYSLPTEEEEKIHEQNLGFSGLT